ncbi:LuxR C-terminal-related transcriptional regulator [Sphingopyxis fribergensis]|uniref:LuxR C-terminal-related transcriptional regulator n=1 Tax=Sphingopyxis fribergensis TaxID=1515612 RepID=UPI00068D7100|nr:response regulator transcription factor [Sphingopyxis fribergensis]
MVWERQLLCRSGLASIIRREFSHCDVATAGDAEQALDWLAATGAHGMLVLDGGIDLKFVVPDGIRGLRRRFPQLSLVIVDWRRDRDAVLRAISDGAHGFVPKDMEQDEMLQAFRQVMAGQVYVPPIVSDVDAETLAKGSSGSHQASISSLTERQREVLTHMSMGKSNKEIARSLRISESTVKVHVAAAFRLLGVHNRVGAVAALQSRGDASAHLRDQFLARRANADFRTRAFG